jgi:hypothetical protein
VYKYRIINSVCLVNIQASLLVPNEVKKKNIYIYEDTETITTKLFNGNELGSLCGKSRVLVAETFPHLRYKHATHFIFYIGDSNRLER